MQTSEDEEAADGISHETKPKRRFIRLVQLWHAVRRWRQQMQTDGVLQPDE